MTEKELVQLRANVAALEACVLSLVVLLANKGVITTDEWKAMNFRTRSEMEDA